MCQQFCCRLSSRVCCKSSYDCGWPLAEGFEISGRDPSEYRKRSAEAERMHPLDVPGHGDEAQLAADAIEPAQQELVETHPLLSRKYPWLAAGLTDQDVKWLRGTDLGM
jgi:hypothetical protein